MLTHLGLSVSHHSAVSDAVLIYYVHTHACIRLHTDHLRLVVPQTKDWKLNMPPDDTCDGATMQVYSVFGWSVGIPISCSWDNQSKMSGTYVRT